MSRTLVIAMLLLMFAMDIVGQDYELNIIQRRKYDQIHAEFWVKSLTPNPALIGDAQLWIEYNQEFLVPNTNTVNGIADSLSKDIDQANPLMQINSEFNSKNGYASLSALNNQTNVGIRARLTTMGNGGFKPSLTGRGNFIGKIIFDIKNSPSSNAQTTIKFLNSNPATNILDVNSVDITSKVSIKQPSNFTITGVTLLSPIYTGQVIDRDKDYSSLANNYKGVGYPIYFERSVNPQSYPGPANGNNAYVLDYNDGAWKELGRVAEHNNQAFGSSALYRSGDVARPTQVGTYVITSSNGQALGSSNFRNPVRILWAKPSNIRDRNSNVKIRIAMLSGTVNDNILDRAKTNLSSESPNTQSMGTYFTSMLNGSNEYFKTEKSFSNPTQLTIEAWINPTKINSGEVGIITSSGGPEQAEIFGKKEGAWMLYLKDGKYPAFRVRENQNRGKDGYLVNLVAEDPINVSTYSTTEDDFSRNWTHISAVLENSVAYLYVDGELVASDIVNKDKDYRALITEHPIWVGVNPNGKLDGKNYFAGGIKEAKVWRAAFKQDSVRKYAIGVVAPSSIDNNFLPDTRTSLDLYFKLNDDLKDFATNAQFQNGANNLQFYKGTQVSANANFLPDLPHGRITSPSRGSGLLLAVGQSYPIRFVSYNLGNNAARFSRDVYLEFSTNGGSTWLQVENSSGLKLGGNNAIDVEDNKATWEPYQNNDVGAGLRDVEPFEKKVLLRITGHETHGQRTISNPTDEFVVSRNFSLKKTKANLIYSDSTRKLLPTEKGLFIETWIKPHRFPTENEEVFPIISMLDSVSNEIKYDLSLNQLGLLEFTYTDSQNKLRKAISDVNKGLLEPISKTSDTAWVHIAVYFNPYDKLKPYLLWIDGNEIGNEFSEGGFTDLNYDSTNNKRMYLGYFPKLQGAKVNYGFEGEFRELRFWKGFPANRNYTNGKLTEFIQGALTVQADRFLGKDTLNLINTFSFNSGLFQKFGKTKTIAASIDSTMIFEFKGLNPTYTAAKAYLRIVSPPEYTRIKQNNTNFKIRWVAFGIDNNGFTGGQRFGNPPSLEFSEKGGAGNSVVPYQYVGSSYWNGNVRNSFTLPDSSNYRFKEFGQNIIYAASLDISNANADMNHDNLFIDQGALPIVKDNIRFRLNARYIVESTPYSIKAESPLYSVIPGENFTLRVLLEGKHSGKTQAIDDLKTPYDKGGIKVSLFENDNGKPGKKVGESEATKSYEEKSSFHQNNGQKNFANLPFLFENLETGKYWVLVEQINHLPIMSKFPAPFIYEGEDKSTWVIESGWDFTSWNGARNNTLKENENPWSLFRYTAFGNSEASRDSVNWFSTGLNYNDGKSSSTINPLPAMVAGDVNQDGKIDSTDIAQILLNSGGSDIKFDLNADSTVNAFDRIMTQSNIGKISSLGEYNYLKYQESSGTTSSIQISNNDIIKSSNIVKSINKSQLLAGVSYDISSLTTVKDSIATVEFFIRSTGDTFKLGNSTFAFTFDTLKLDYITYSNKDVIFSNNKTAGYLTSFSAPNAETQSPYKNLRTIEIVLEKGKDGLVVPSELTSLGKLNFKIKTKDAIVQFKWHNSTLVYSNTGQNILAFGTKEDISPVKQFKIELLNPKGGRSYSIGQKLEISWLNEGNPIQLEYFNGVTWNKISDSVFTKEVSKFNWTLPNTENFNARVRIIDAQLQVELVKSDKFVIERKFGQIVSPSSNDGVLSGGDFIQIYFTASGFETVDFEYTDDGGDNWKPLKKNVGAKSEKFSWMIPRKSTNIMYIRMINGSEIIDISDKIRVLNGTLDLNTPNASTIWATNTNQRIRWTYSDVDYFTLQFSLDAGDNWLNIESNLNAHSRYYNWDVPGIESEFVLIRAIWNDDPEMLYDITSSFTIDLSSSTEFDEKEEKSLKLISYQTINNSVKVFSEKNINCNIYIYDLDGQLYQETKTYFTIGNNDLYLEKELADGIYFILIQNENIRYFNKFIKD